jgi:hypothetical protein
MKLLASLRHRIETGESRQSLLHFLEQARVEYLSARIRLRAMLHYHRGFPEESLFEAGIFRLLHSGLVHLEEGRVVQASYGEDTLLDIMYSVQHANEPVPNYLIIEFIHKQEWTLKHAFEEITLGFEQLRKSIVKKP